MIKHVRSHFYQVLHTPCRWCGAKTPRMDNHKMVCTKNPHNKIKRKYTFQDPRNRAPRQPIDGAGGQLAITGSINGIMNQEYDMFVGDMNDGDEGLGEIRFYFFIFLVCESKIDRWGLINVVQVKTELLFKRKTSI